MEERKNYVVYAVVGCVDEVERIANITEEQARAIKWFINNFDINGYIELLENYEGEVI